MHEPSIEWQDLRTLGPFEIARELCLPVPWLALALLAPHPALVAGATLVLFMTGLRVTHGAFHRTLGIPRAAGDVVMFALSVLLGGAMHAIEYTHLRHHRHCLAHDDVEGRIASLGFCHALVHSATYPLRIHAAAVAHGSRRQRAWVALELTAVALVHGVLWTIADAPLLEVMALTLYFANASAAMVGIWAVHRGCSKGPHMARTSRTRWLDVLVVHMFHHLEHHQFPAVPTCHLAELARRLDAQRGGVQPPPRVFALG